MASSSNPANPANPANPSTTSTSPITTTLLPSYKTTFLNSCLAESVLTFGSFTLKSGRKSPYFFHAEHFHRADLLRILSTAYAQSLLEFLSQHPLEIDVLFGPAYGGIVPASSTMERLAEFDPGHFARLSYSSARKEFKDHGEKGVILGCPLKGKKVLVLDDVITAGTAVGEAVDIIRKEGGVVVGILVAMDRMETMSGGGGEKEGRRTSAIEEVRRKYGIPVISIVTLDDLIGHLSQSESEENMRALEEYKRKYRADR